MRVNQTAIGDFFLGQKTADEVIKGYGIDASKERETAEGLKSQLTKDLKRFRKGIEIYTYECDRRYSKWLNTKGYDLPIVR